MKSGQERPRVPSTPGGEGAARHLAPPDTGDAAPGAPADTVESQSILQGRKSVQIEHNGATYQLRTTRLGKLILTK